MIIYLFTIIAMVFTVFLLSVGILNQTTSIFAIVLIGIVSIILSLLHSSKNDTKELTLEELLEGKSIPLEEPDNKNKNYNNVTNTDNKTSIYLKIIIVLLVSIIFILFYNNSSIGYKFIKITPENFYSLYSSISDSNLNATEKSYLKLGFFNYTLNPSGAYNKRIYNLIDEGKQHQNRLNESLEDAFKQLNQLFK